MPRLHRKNEHIYQSLRKIPGRADFSDIHLIHNCLPNQNLDEISLKTVIMGRTFRSPLFINALTGGTKLALIINAALAGVAKECGLPLAVGSQKIALENRAAEKSFRVVRRLSPEGIIWSNIGSYADPDTAQKAVQMIKADGLQIHLNSSQELMMGEGDRSFKNTTERLEQISKNIQIPVIVKEVGFGIAREQAADLIKAGVSAIDVGGRGGTNFLEIESRRSGKRLSKSFKNWGIPTAISLIEVLDVSRKHIDVFASGGVNHALDITKALALGANAVGMAGLPINLLLKKGSRALIHEIRTIEHEMRQIMMMLGTKSIAELQQVPLVISGFTAEWLQQRGIDLSSYARRNFRLN